VQLNPRDALQRNAVLMESDEHRLCIRRTPPARSARHLSDDRRSRSRRSDDRRSRSRRPVPGRRN